MSQNFLTANAFPKNFGDQGPVLESLLKMKVTLDVRISLNISFWLICGWIFEVLLYYVHKGCKVADMTKA